MSATSQDVTLTFCLEARLELTYFSRDSYSDRMKEQAKSVCGQRREGGPTEEDLVVS